jgi:putative thioredoxin
MLLKDGKIVDGFPGALPEAQLREFLSRHGIEPAANEDAAFAEEPALAPEERVQGLRAQVAAEPDNAALQLDLAVALLSTGESAEAEQLLNALPANLATDDRARRARARLGFAHLLEKAPSADALQTRISANAADSEARHLLGVHQIVAGDNEAGLETLLDLLRHDKPYSDGLPRKALIEAFSVVEDDDLVGRYRRKMASLLF